MKRDASGAAVPTGMPGDYGEPMRLIPNDVHNLDLVKV
jgi:hypothetical protein